MDTPPKNVLIVSLTASQAQRNCPDCMQIGGSISGLMHGVVLRSLGYNVHILEAREPEALKAEAGGLSLGPQALELVETFLPHVAPFMIPSTHTQFLGADEKLFREIPIAFPVEITGWNLLFDRLKAAFLEENGRKGSGRYDTGRRVTDVSDLGQSVAVTLEGISNNSLEADLVIAADGGRSVLRSKSLPDCAPVYAGYIAWRGCVPEASVPDVLGGAFEGKLLMHLGENNYILA